MGLYQGCPGGRLWRRYLSENAVGANVPPQFCKAHWMWCRPNANARLWPRNGRAADTDMVLLTLGLLASGYVSGIIAGLLGVGGGIILVPVLFQTFVWFDFPAHLHIHMAVGTSLAIICFTGGQSARSHLKRGAVDIEILKSWAAFIGLGALLGALWHA